MVDLGLKFLTDALALALASAPGEPIKVYDGNDEGEWDDYFVPAEAARVAHDVDGPVTYHIGDVALTIIYDGPYTTDNAAEIVNDSNAAWEALVGSNVSGTDPEAGGG